MKKLLISVLSMGVFLAACQKGNEEHVAPQTSGHAVVVQEVIQANAYTYLNVAENGQTFWIAITKADIKEGQKLYYDSGLEMTNFESKDLNRTFESIYFVDQISDLPHTTPPPAMSDAAGHTGKPEIEQQQVTVQPAAGGVTIAELYKNRQQYKNKVITVRGQVVKVNSGIMGRNWVHIQDGTSSDGKFDLTITTQDNAQIGDVLTFEGTVFLEKDFGAGYYYDVIVEQATVSREQAL